MESNNTAPSHNEPTTTIMEIQDYTQHQLSEEGTFRAFPIAWTIEQSTKAGSQSVAIAFKFAIHGKWWGKDKGDGQAHGWSQEWAPGYFTENRTWIVKKDGELNSGAIDSLSKCSLWDGDWDKLEGAPPSVFVLLDVGAETWEGKERFRANWINPDAAEPASRGGFKPVDPSMVSAMRSRFGQQTKAIAGGASAPATAAVQPQPAQAQPAVQAQPVQAQPLVQPAPPAAASSVPQPPTPQPASPPAGLVPPVVPQAPQFPAPGGGPGTIDPNASPF